ncbi:hypothetical protein NCCP2145_26810 [Pseudarthrobacter sp. NCCP-2145]|nr:hypothetical protein NCCP2145_26810 [Pseudarthrobacter sp. NCCP-2145]
MGLGQQGTGGTVTDHQRTADLGHQAPVLAGGLLRRGRRTVHHTRGGSEHLNRPRLHRCQLRLRPRHPRKNIQRIISNPLQRIITNPASVSARLNATKTRNIRTGTSRTGNSSAAEHRPKSSHRSVNCRLRLHHRRRAFHTDILQRGSDKKGSVAGAVDD